MNRQRKAQFIAGARCPKCNQTDVIQLERRDGVSQFTCVACGHQEVQSQAPVADATRRDEQLIGVYTP